MKALPLSLLLAGLFAAWLPMLATAGSLDASLVGRYLKVGDSREHLDLRADGTFTIVQGRTEGASGDCTTEGNKVSLVMPGRPIVLEIVNGSFTGPGGTKWQKAPGVAPEPPPAILPNYIGKSVARAAAQHDAAEQLVILKCENNVKQLLASCQQWATDHNGIFPDTLNELFTDKYLGAGKEDMLLTPLAKNEKTEGYVYYGKRQAVALAADKILILSKWVDSDGKRIVGHRDGSVVLDLVDRGNFPDSSGKVAVPGSPMHQLPRDAPKPPGSSTPPAGGAIAQFTLTAHDNPKFKPENRYSVHFPVKEMPVIGEKKNYVWVLDPPSHKIDVKPLDRDLLRITPEGSGTYKVTVEYRSGSEKKVVSNVAELVIP